MSSVERPTIVAQLSGGPVEYRFEQRGDAAVLVFHGGHMRAGLPLGERVFEELGYSVLAPSRPGYGKTNVRSARSPCGFAEATFELCTRLGIDRVAAVMAMSAGGRTGLAMAANHPDLVPKLILEAAVGFQPWPDRWVRIGARAVFNPLCEPAVWLLVRTMMRRAPDIGLRAMMRSLSTLPPAAVVGGLSQEERTTLAELFARMRSGGGFTTDLKFARKSMTANISQPTLIVASANDGAVPLTQAECLEHSIVNAKLKVADSTSHFLWFGPGSAETSDAIRSFLCDVP
jgi:pimeloyl-ACP methyl ester carboxylesterase